LVEFSSLVSSYSIVDSKVSYFITTGALNAGDMAIFGNQLNLYVLEISLFFIAPSIGLD